MTVERIPAARTSQELADRTRFSIDALLGIHRTTSHSGGTIPVLDGVRAVAALSVLTFHLNLKTLELRLWSESVGPLPSALMLSGSSGVTLFFVLSGLLLFLPYARALLSEDPWPGAGKFYLRRALRIIPGYYVSIALLVLLSQPQYLRPSSWGHLALFALFLNDSSKQTYRQLNGPFWTLAIEWQFYLLLPWIALALHALARLVAARLRLWVGIGGLLGLMVWGVASRSWGAYLLAHPAATVPLPQPVPTLALIPMPRGILDGVLLVTYGQSGKYLEDFAVGMLIGLLYVYLSQHERRETLAARMRRLSPWLFMAGVLLFVVMAAQLYSLNFYHGRWPWFVLDTGFRTLWPLNELGFALAYGACVLAVLFSRHILPAIFAWTPLRWIGAISYSLYLWHLPLLLVLLSVMGPVPPAWPSILTYGLFWLWAAVLILPCSLLMYLLVEQPGMHLNERLRARVRASRNCRAA